MSDIRDKYRIISTGAGWFANPGRGRLRFDGRDAVSFLQALLSNDIDVVEGRGVYATYLTPQGRMMADLYVYRRPGHVLATVPADLATTLATRFDQLIFSEDVRVADVSAQTLQLTVIGGRAASAVAAACGLDPAELEALPALAQLGDGDHVVVRMDQTTPPRFDIVAPAGRRDDLVAALEREGAVAVAPDLQEALRIDDGRPEFGVDMTSDTIPLEAGLLERAISTSKGCYVGQEVIIRVLHRGGGRVAKRLVKVAFDSALDVLPPAGTPLHVDDRETGRLTSVAWSPHEPRAIALAYVHRDHAEVGRRVVAEVRGGKWNAEITGFAG